MCGIDIKLQLNSVASGRIQARSDSVRRQELAQRLIARIAAPCKLLGQRKGEGTGLLSTCLFFYQIIKGGLLPGVL